jgi:TonB family protein
LIGAIVVLVALLMGAVLGMRVGWLKGNVAGRASGAAQALKAPASSAISSPASSSASSSSSSEPRTSSNGPVDAVGVTAGGENKSASGSAGNSAENDPTPEGGLRVFENGREIFRMDAAKNAPRTATTVATQPNVAEGGLFLRVEPKYPEQALAQRVQGPVVLKIGITAEGTVQEIKIVSGAPILADAAIAAVRQWRFRPRTEGGRAVGMETQITLNFTLPSR